jgi:RND family efflux transporter MFP subunit
MPPTNRSRLLAVAGTLLILVLFLAGLVPRLIRQRELQAESNADAGPLAVLTVTAHQAAPVTAITLPGTVEALHEAQIYARTSGYVRQWQVDIGTKVKAGQLLADLASPDLDQELLQARAAVAQNHATAVFARTSLERWRSLERDSAISRQELDEKTTAAEAADAAEAAATANAQRLAELKGFTRITAPFSGVITSRAVDVGSLVTPGVGSQGKGLFSVAQTDSLRVYVRVPEAYASGIQIGRPAEVRVASAPTRTLSGTIARTAQAVDPASRTLLTEVVISNRDGSLLPGVSAIVSLKVERRQPVAIVPANALLVSASGTRVITVDKDVLGSQDVVLGRDFGDSVEVVSGLRDGQTVVANPGEELLPGMRVKATPQPAPK